MKHKKKRRWWLIIGVAIGGLLCCIGTVLLAPESLEQAAPASEYTREPAATPTPLPDAPPYAEIKANLASMTEAQWAAYIQELEGTYVREWYGWVYDVGHPAMSSRWAVYVDMENPADTLLPDYEVHFIIPESAALALNKGDFIKFSGPVELVADIFGVQIKLGDGTEYILATRYQGGVVEID